jgi:hypothetical protein
MQMRQLLCVNLGKLVCYSIMSLLLPASLITALYHNQMTQAQGFSSGSTGTDGALDFSSSPPGAIIEFDPAAFNPQLDPERDNIYHFTTITIPANVTVRLTAKHLTGPVFWLATGAVQINGVIDLNGANGHGRTGTPAGRIPSVPGAGGFGGGVGGYNCGTNPAPPQPGNGPLGGGPSTPSGFNSVAGGGGFGGNQFLVPLVGGSGGGGKGRNSCNEWGTGGGAGGGALLIASSTSITVNGTITANGGSGFPCVPFEEAGSGGGGAIRLVASIISGTGTLSANGGPGGCAGGPGGNGRLRLEAFQNNFTGTLNTQFTRSSPTNTFLSATPPPSIRVVSVAGAPVPSTPNGSFELPDVTINQDSAVPVAIEAKFVPVGTIVKVHIFSEDGADQIVDSMPLQGTLAESTATASIVFPPGFSRGFARVVWRP